MGRRLRTRAAGSARVRILSGSASRLLGNEAQIIRRTRQSEQRNYCAGDSVCESAEEDATELWRCTRNAPIVRAIPRAKKMPSRTSVHAVNFSLGPKQPQFIAKCRA